MRSFMRPAALLEGGKVSHPSGVSHTLALHYAKDTWTDGDVEGGKFQLLR